MKLSISMLAWYMREYKPVCSIKNDKQMISGVRFLADEAVLLSPDFAYVGAASGFISDEKYEHGYIVVHCQDFLLFNGPEFDILLNKLLSAIDYFDSWEARLREAADANAPLQTFIALGEEVMGDFFVVCDLETNLIASSKVDPADIMGTTWEYFFAHKKVSFPSMNSSLTDERGRHIPDAHPYPLRVTHDNPTTSDLITQYLFQDEEPIAYFSANQTKDSFSDMQMQVIPVLCAHMIRAREFNSLEPVAQSNARLFARLLRGETPEEGLMARFRRKMPGEAFRVLFFFHPLRQDSVHGNVFLSYLRSQNILCTSVERGVAALIADENWESVTNRLLHSSGLTGLRCGVSTPSTDIAAIVPRYKQAQFAAAQPSAQGDVLCCEDYAFSYLLNTLRNSENTAFLLHPAIEKLSAYDIENQNELLITLDEYLGQNKNLQKTLEALNIHRSTLKYRLQRIMDLTGICLDDPQEEAYLRLSLWLKSEKW